MNVIALASVKGSPGVTTATLALAATWPGRVLLVEADPAGGDVLAGYGRGALPPGPGLLELATAARRALTPGDVLAHSIPLDTDGRLRLVAGTSGPGPLATVTPSLPAITAALRDLAAGPDGWDVLVDAGRLDVSGAPWPLLAGGDLVVLVARPSLRQVRHLRAHLPAVREHLDRDGAGPRLGLLLVGDTPYDAGEVAGAVGLPVLAVLADDPAAAAVLSEGTAPHRGFTRSPLLRSARHAGQQLRATATAAVPAAAVVLDGMDMLAGLRPAVLGTRT